MATTSQRIANRRMARGKRSQTSQLRKCRPPLLRLHHRKNTKNERPITDNSLFAARVLYVASVAHHAPLIGERAATRGRIATEGGDEATEGSLTDYVLVWWSKDQPVSSSVPTAAIRTLSNRLTIRPSNG